MRLSLMAGLSACVILAACGGLRESRVNPANWFGNSTEAEIPEGKVVNADGELVDVNPLIGERNQQRQRTSRLNPGNSTLGDGSTIFSRNKKEKPYEGTLVARVEDLKIRPTGSGAIVDVTGLSSRQGAYDVRLIALNDGQPVDGVLTYELRAVQPFQTAQGPARTRMIRAAAPLSVKQLENIRTIRIVASTNTQTSRR